MIDEGGSTTLTMSTSLEGKVAIIMSCSSSIGAAIARRLADEGANVIINYLTNLQAADEVVSDINSKGKGKAVSVRADVTSNIGVNFLLGETVRAFGKFDILILNAGIMGSQTLSDLDEQFFNTHINLNVKGPLFLTKAAVPLLPSGVFCGDIHMFFIKVFTIIRWAYHLLFFIFHQGNLSPSQRARLRCLQSHH